MRPVLCLVTDRHRLASATPSTAAIEDRLVALADAAARAGVDLIQVRELDLEGAALTRIVERCVAAVRGTSARVIVNDRLDVALAAGAHGLHLPGHGVPAARVRAVVPRGFLIGRSVHHFSEAARVAGEGGLDYLIFGTVFPTASKEGIAPAGVDGLASAAAAVAIPVLGIGGVTLDRMADVARSGAAGVAAIGLFADAWQSDPGAFPRLVADAVGAWANMRAG